MTTVPPVLSQRTYPGAGDVDDCWVVATVWAAVASRPEIFQPSVPYFRARAHKPDLPGPSGGNIDDCFRGAVGSWPTLEPIVKWVSASWEATGALIRAGNPCSVAVDSAHLPFRIRYGFLGKHQIGVMWANGKLYAANPLAIDGSAPVSITWTELRDAMAALVYPTSYRMVIFPVPVSRTHTVHFRPLTTVRIYSLSSRPGVDCIAGYREERWGLLPSSAAGDTPVHRATCDGESGAWTVRVRSGRYNGRTIQVAGGVTVTKD